jgi:hypothetical protein
LHHWRQDSSAVASRLIGILPSEAALQTAFSEMAAGSTSVGSTPRWAICSITYLPPGWRFFESVEHCVFRTVVDKVQWQEAVFQLRPWQIEDDLSAAVRLTSTAAGFSRLHATPVRGAHSGSGGGILPWWRPRSRSGGRRVGDLNIPAQPCHPPDLRLVFRSYLLNDTSL